MSAIKVKEDEKMDYRLVFVQDFSLASAIEKFEDQVQMFLKMGFRPIGGVSVSRNKFGSLGEDNQITIIAQAMIKE